MKKQILLSFSALALVTLACNLMSGPGGDAGVTEAPEVPGDSGAAPTEAPVTEAPAVSEGAGAGPETIDLSNPALYPNDTYPAFKMDFSYKYEGVDTSGNPRVLDQNMKVESQKEPKVQHIMLLGESPEENAEFLIMEDQSLSVFPGVGCSVFPTSSMEGEGADQMIPDFGDSFFKGQAQRVETGIDIEGILTDRYAFTSENMVDTEEEFTNITDGSVYVAQDGGYIVRIEFTGTNKTATLDFDPNTETQLSMNYTFIPVTDGSMVIAPPSECADKLSGESKYPVMEGATDLVLMGDITFYKVDVPLEDVQNFYRTKMVEEGWTMTKDIGGGSFTFITQEFTKDGETVEVGIAKTGTGIAVSITEK